MGLVHAMRSNGPLHQVYHDGEVTFSKDQFDTEDLVMLQSGLVWFLDKILEP